MTEDIQARIVKAAATYVLVKTVFDTLDDPDAEAYSRLDTAWNDLESAVLALNATPSPAT